MDTTASVFNIQSYSIHDGPGIRTTVFLKGCPLRCLWCANPESHTSLPQLMIYSGKCTVCGKCISVCPHNSISLREQNGKPTVITDRESCRSCGLCVDVCPTDAREIVGKTMSVREVLDRVLEDKLFLESSGGGITLSGGEPLMQPDFSESLLSAAKAEGLHTAIESCCFASRDVISRVFAHVDLGLPDIKHMDSKRHKKFTGVPNEPILDNLRYIYHELKTPFMVSLPVIPGYNDSRENITATASFIAAELGKDVPLRLLPYHRLGEGKAESLGKRANLEIALPSDEHMQQLKTLAESFGLQVQIGG